MDNLMLTALKNYLKNTTIRKVFHTLFFSPNEFEMCHIKIH